MTLTAVAARYAEALAEIVTGASSPVRPQDVLDELKASPIPEIPIPPYPNYHKDDGLGKN